MSFRQLRKLPGLDGIVKDLAEKLQRSQADQGVEDVALFRQNRVEYGEVSITDEGGPLDAALQKAGADSIAYTDSEAALLQDSGGFQITDDSGAGATQVGIVGFSDCGGGE